MRPPTPSFGAGPNGEGPVNLSPKGAADLQVIDRHTIAYFDYRGSGNETARHTAAGGPITVMVTSFDEDAAIVRLYGRAVAKPLEESVLAEQAEALRAVEMPTPERQVIEISVELHPDLMRLRCTALRVPGRSIPGRARAALQVTTGSGLQADPAREPPRLRLRGAGGR